MGTDLRARSWRLAATVMAILLALGMLPGLVSPRPAFAQVEELSQSEFEDLIDQAQEEEPIFGPEDGELEHDPDLVTFSEADVELADFLATATFGNPYAGSREQFDYGIQFRVAGDAGDVSYLRFIVLSTTDWGVTNNDGDIIVQGVYEDLDVSRRGENELTLYAQGSVVHLGINGDYVGSAEVDNEDEGEIAVGTSFFEESYQDDAATGFFEFTVWELSSPGSERDDDPLGRRDDEEPPPSDEDEGQPPDEEEQQPPAEEDEDTQSGDDEDQPPAEDEDTQSGDDDPPTPQEDDDPTATEESTPGEDEPTVTGEADGARYASPTYGYGLEYDESWQVRTESSADDVDLFEISNGPSSLQFLGFASSETPNECIATLIARLGINDSVDSVEIALDENDEEMRGKGETEAFVVLTVTYAGETGDPVVFGVYYGCYQIADRALLQVTHLVLIDDYNAEIENRAAVLATLDLDGDGEPDLDQTPAEDDPTPAGDEETSTPEDGDPTPADDDSTPTDELAEDAVAIYLGSTTSANTSVIGTMVPDGAGAEIVLFLVQGEPGAEYAVTINTGSCASPGPVELEAGTVDANGLAETTVDASVEELSNGDYIMVVADAESPDEPVACGNLADLVED